jgi:hypothetical protein
LILFRQNIWKFRIIFLSFFDKRSGKAERQRERWNQVEPRCAALGFAALLAKNGGICVMMSNSTFLRPAGSKPA